MPVKHGDTMHLVVTPSEKRLSSKGDHGIFTVWREILRQRDEIMQPMKTA